MTGSNADAFTYDDPGDVVSGYQCWLNIPGFDGGHPPPDGWTSGGYKYFDFYTKWQHLEYEVVEDINGVVFLYPYAYYTVADVDISLYVPLNNKGLFTRCMLGLRTATEMTMRLLFIIQKDRIGLITLSCNRAFTLAELLVVIAIIGILAAILLPEKQQLIKRFAIACVGW